MKSEPREGSKRSQRWLKPARAPGLHLMPEAKPPRHSSAPAPVKPERFPSREPSQQLHSDADERPQREQILKLLEHCAATEIEVTVLSAALEKTIAERDNLAEVLEETAKQTHGQIEHSQTIVEKVIEPQTQAVFAGNRSNEPSLQPCAISVSPEMPETSITARLLQESKLYETDFPDVTVHSSINSRRMSSSSTSSESFDLTASRKLGGGSAKQKKGTFLRNSVQDEWNVNYNPRVPHQQRKPQPKPFIAEKQIEKLTQERPLTFDALIQTDEVFNKVDESSCSELPQNRRSQKTPLLNSNLPLHECRSTESPTKNVLLPQINTFCEHVCEKLPPNSPPKIPHQSDYSTADQQKFVNTYIQTGTSPVLAEPSTPQIIPSHCATSVIIEQENQNPLLFTDLDASTIETIERLLPSDNSLLFSNDTSMPKPLREVIQEIEAQFPANCENVLESAKFEIQERYRANIADMEKKSEIIKEIRRLESLNSSVNLHIPKPKPVKSSMKKVEVVKDVSDDVANVISKMNWSFNIAQ